MADLHRTNLGCIAMWYATYQLTEKQGRKVNVTCKEMTIMSTDTLTETSSFLPQTQQGLLGTIFARIRLLVSALAEAKAAADHYETLTARGMPPGEASSLVFQTHFGQR